MPIAPFSRHVAAAPHQGGVSGNRTVDGIVNTLTRSCSAAWNRTPGLLPDTLPVFSKQEQYQREAAAEELVHRWSAVRPSRREATSRIITLVAEMDEQISADREVCRRIMDDMAEAGRRLTVKARSFDDTLPAESLAQALRNLWVMNSIQVLCGQPVQTTPSCFAYSLLYPLTDNLLDDPQLPDEAKRAFIHRLGARLAGCPGAKPLAPREQRIWELLLMIEREWPRRRFPHVYESLLAIHGAQTSSVHLHHPALPPPPGTVLRLTFAKGGSSVLAHGFLLRGALPMTACRWIFGFGTVLQMIDDVQDLHEDRVRGHMTVFSLCHEPEALCLQIHRLFGYAEQTAAGFPPADDTRRRVLLRLIRGSCVMLVCEAVASLECPIPAPLSAPMESRSPLSFASLRSLRKRAGDLLTSKSLDMFRENADRPALRQRLAAAW